MLRLETAIPAIIVLIMVSGAAIGVHRVGVKEEFIAQCVKTQSAQDCQTQWWRSPVRKGWTTDDLWACWVGNPDACVEEAERMKAERTAPK